jgi:phospholipase C
MENRSFDHFLGWLPGADGQQAGLTFTDQAGAPHSTHYLGNEYNGCSHPDPDHSYEGGRVQYNGGAMDGWLHKGSGDDDFALGYYQAADRPFMSNLALNYTSCDRYFCSILAETYPNRFYMHAAQTDRLHNNGIATTTLYPTIWDRLQAKGVSHRYYFSDIPFLGLWSTKYLSISAPYAQFLVEAATGTLPAVSFVDPRFLGEGALVDVGPNDTGGGLSNDDHPHADIRAGEDFMNQVYKAISTSSTWKSTVLVITYDDWGGFFDHVPPGHAEDVSRQTSLRGFRVPTVVISPFARRNHVAHRTHDHASVLKMIEWRWGLKPLTVRDHHANNLAKVLDFTSPANLTHPAYAVTPFDGRKARCASPAGEPGPEAGEWAGLKKLALQHGWKIG